MTASCSFAGVGLCGALFGPGAVNKTARDEKLVRDVVERSRGPRVEKKRDAGCSCRSFSLLRNDYTPSLLCNRWVWSRRVLPMITKRNDDGEARARANGFRVSAGAHARGAAGQTGRRARGGRGATLRRRRSPGRQRRSSPNQRGDLADRAPREQGRQRSADAFSLSEAGWERRGAETLQKPWRASRRE